MTKLISQTKMTKSISQKNDYFKFSVCLEFSEA